MNEPDEFEHDREINFFTKIQNGKMPEPKSEAQE